MFPTPTDSNLSQDKTIYAGTASQRRKLANPVGWTAARQQHLPDAPGLYTLVDGVMPPVRTDAGGGAPNMPDAEPSCATS